MKIFVAFLFIGTLAFAEDKNQFVCTKNNLEISSSVNQLIVSGEEITQRIDPEVSSLCNGLIPKSDSDQEKLTYDEKFQNTIVRQDFKTKSPYPTSKEAYCSSKSEDMLRRFCLLKGKLGHDNQGGFFGLETGVCWWNSQFHRKVNYLTFYDPSVKSDYSDAEVKKIIKDISKNKVTKISGYDSFSSFINDPKFPSRHKILQQSIQKDMEVKTLQMEWVNGFKGKPNVALKASDDYSGLNRQRRRQLEQIDKIREQLLDQKKVAFAVVQQPGFNAHSYLIYDYINLTDHFQNKAIKIRVQDSVFQSPNGGFTDTNYVFDIKAAQWFTEEAYKKLEKNREKGIEPKIVVDHSGWQSKELTDQLALPDVVGSTDWTLWNHKNSQMNKIDEAFKQFCGHNLFE